MTEARPLAVVLPVFLVTRAAIGLASTSIADSIVYRQYGVAARTASVAALLRQDDVARGAFALWLHRQLHSIAFTNPHA